MSVVFLLSINTNIYTQMSLDSDVLSFFIFNKLNILSLILKFKKSDKIIESKYICIINKKIGFLTDKRSDGQTPMALFCILLSNRQTKAFYE